MRRAILVLLLAAVLALPGARASGFDFPSGRSFAQTAGEGGVNVFSIPFHANADGFVYLKMLDTPANAAHNGAAPNGSAAAKTGWWIEWALTQGGATRELGARNDGTPTETLAVAAGEDDIIILRVHWPAAANTAGASDLVYGALAFRVTASGQDPGANSGAQMDEARSFHVQIDMPGGGAAAVPTPTASPTAAPSASATATAAPSATPATGGSQGAISPTASPIAANGDDTTSPTPPVSGVNVGGTRSGGASNGTTVQVINEAAPLPSWVVPVLVGQALLVLAVCVVALLAARRPQRIEIVVRSDPATGAVSVAEAGAATSDPGRSIAVREK